MKAAKNLETVVAHKPPRPVQFIAIAPGSRSESCRYCGSQIYFAPHPSTGNPHPVSTTLHPAAYAPTSTTFGQGVTHFADKNCSHGKPLPRFRMVS